jgi:DNA-binding NarL/FixJ family response regulator
MTESIPVRVLLVDDHSLYRQGLRMALAGHPELQVAGEAADGAQAMEMFGRIEPDMVVLDVHLPDTNGLELARQIRGSRPGVRLVILTMLRDEEVFNAALDLGVLGYVLKECAAEDIVECIRTVTRGEPYVSSQLSASMMRRRAAPDPAAAGVEGVFKLTTAERRVLKLLAKSRTTKEIAQELGVSPRTIEAHRANMGSKLGLKGSHSLLRFAIANESRLGEDP